jgi:flagellar M-ring protein FliF
MPTQLTDALRRLLGAVREFTIAQRTLAILAVLVLVLGGVALSAWLARPTYSPLFSGLSGEDASAIVDQLATDGVQYQLADGGSTIMVPADKVDSERLSAAAAGLPTAGTNGYALLDTMGVTASEFQQNVTYKRAIEGELAKTIESMDGVKTASVQLAVPEKTVFVDDANDPTASVFLETQGGALSAQQVQAIVHLTSAAVDGLKAENVSVVDSKGTLLSAVGTGAAGDAGQQAVDYEQRVRQSVQAMLDKVVGPGNSTVVVAADVSNETAQRVAESYTIPDGDPVLSEATTSETYAGAGAGNAATGVLGPDNVAVPNGTGTAADANNSYVNSSATKNNAVDKVTETRSIPAGGIDRQTISVAVNSEAVKGIAPGVISSLVSAAAGIDPSRGDTVTVQTASFSTEGADAAAKALAQAEDAKNQDNLTHLITTAAIALVAVVALIVLLVAFRRRSRKREDSGPIELGDLPIGLDPTRGLDATRAWPLASGGVPPALSDTPTTPLSVAQHEISEFERMQADINQLAMADPEKTADYLRALMDDRVSG